MKRFLGQAVLTRALMSKVMDIGGRQYVFLTRALVSMDIGGRQNPVVKRFLGQAVLTRALMSKVPEADGKGSGGRWRKGCRG